MKQQHKFILLNEMEVGRLLGEERHYPSFLDGFKSDVISKFKAVVSKMMDECETRKSFDIEVDSEYCKRIEFDVELVPDNNSFDVSGFDFRYSNESEFVDGKIDKPKIECVIPYQKKYKESDLSMAEVFLTHELTHLFDDLMALKNGKDSIFFDNVNLGKERLEILNSLNGSMFARALADMVYMANRIEERAYLSEVFSELAYYGCNEKNCQEKLKETLAYKNIRNAKDNFDEALDYADFKEITACLNLIRKIMPKLRIKDCGNNNRWQRKELALWADRVERRYLKRYYSTVGYYLDTKKNNTIK